MSDEVRQVAIAVVERDGCVLVGKRPPGIELAGFHEFPGGKVEADETIAQAAARECAEETGLEVEVVGAYATQEQRYEFGTLKLHFFKCRPRPGAGEPRAPYRWIELAAIDRLQFPAANAAVLAELVARGRGDLSGDADLRSAPAESPPICPHQDDCGGRAGRYS